MPLVEHWPGGQLGKSGGNILQGYQYAAPNGAVGIAPLGAVYR
jgi:hypothetical protein